MVKINRFILHSGFATFKNEDGSEELEITVPANVAVPSGSPYGLYTNSVEIDLGSPGSAIIARGKSSKDMVDFGTSAVIIPANTWIPAATIVSERVFTHNVNPSIFNLFGIEATVARPSPTKVRLTINIANFAGTAVTGPSTAETFTFRIWTNLSPFRSDI